jgi:hypothetical protein
MSISAHRLLFKLKCTECKESAFQKFFEEIMQRHDKTFMPVRPVGSEGDWKCDGYSAGSQTVYQCYSPAELRTGKTAKKVNTDFTGALKKWGDSMRNWTFVWNGYALPPHVVAQLNEIQFRFAQRVKIDHLGPEKLWTEIVSKLPPTDLIELLGEIQLHPELIESKLRLAAKLIRQGDLSEAKDLCEEILTATKDSPDELEPYFEAANLMVVTSLQNDDVEGARRSLENGRARFSENHVAVLRAQFYHLEGTVLMREGQLTVTVSPIKVGRGREFIP